MKKLLSVVSVVCLLSLIFCFPASAASEKEVLFVVETSGNTITVDVNTEFNCGGIQGVLSYDGGEIVYNNAVLATGLSNYNTANNSFSNSSGATKVALVCDATNGVNGNLATITYESEANTPALFNFGSLKAFNANGSKLTNVKSVVVFYGDTNADGLLNLLDLVRYKKVLANSASVPTGKERNFDLDKDGQNEVSDIVVLRKKLLAK